MPDDLRSLATGEIAGGERVSPDSPAGSGEDEAPATPVPAKRRRGRPKRTCPVVRCDLCRELSSSQDAVHRLLYGQMEPGEGVPTQKWAYPDVDGRKQGSVDFYCDMTVKACYPSESVRELKTKLVDPDAFTKFKDELGKVVRICADKAGEGVSVLKLKQSMAASSVVKQKRSTLAHKNRGKCMTVERFKAVFKKATQMG